MRFEEKKLSGETVYRGRVIELQKDSVLLPNGKTGTREVIRHNGGSAVYCEKDGKILLVKQFRYAYNQELWEIPAGKVDKGEDPIKTAFRELEEEGGVKAEEMELMFTEYPSPGYTSEIIRIYKAKGLKAGNANLDEDEFLTAEWIEKDKVKEMIKNGEIRDSKTLIALLSAFAAE